MQIAGANLLAFSVAENALDGFADGELAYVARRFDVKKDSSRSVYLGFSPRWPHWKRRMGETTKLRLFL